MKLTISMCASIMGGTLLLSITPSVSEADRIWSGLIFTFVFGFLIRAVWRHIQNGHNSGPDTLRSIFRIGSLSALLGFFIAFTGLWIKNKNEHFWLLIIIDAIFFVLVARSREAFTRPKADYFVCVTTIPGSDPKRYNVGIGAYFKTTDRRTIQELTILASYLRHICREIKPHHSTSVETVIGNYEEDKRLFVSNRIITEFPTEYIEQFLQQGFLNDWPPNRATRQSRAI